MKKHNILTFSLLVCASGLLVISPAAAQDRQAHFQCTDKHLIGASQSKLQDALFSGINNRDLLLLEMAISCGADVNKANNYGWTPLYRASDMGHLEEVQALIAAGADVNKANNYGWTPLYWASQRGKFEVMQVLIAAGADVNKANNYGWTSLNEASETGKFEVVQALIAAGADVNKADTSGSTPLYEASANGKLEVVQALIAAGADVNKADNGGWTPLSTASYWDKLEVVQALIAAGADVNKADNGGWTPLYGASATGNLGVVQALIAAGADVNKADNDGWTPLFGAIMNSNLGVVFVAIVNGNLGVVQALIAAGADVNKADNDGWTPLYQASYRGNLEVTKALIDATDSFASWSRSSIEATLRKMITHEYGNRAWTGVIELFEARTGVTRASLAAAKRVGYSSNNTSILNHLSKEALQELIGDKTLIGIVTVSGLTFDSIVQVGKHVMTQDKRVMIMYVTDSILNTLGAEAFSGFIFPGAGDNYPWDKAMFTLEDMPESGRTSTELLYQKAYDLAKAHNIPTFGICAGAQHLVLNRGGALMKKKNDSRNIKLQPFNPIHYMTLTDAERASTLDDCETPEVEMNVFRAHSYAAEADHLGEDIRLASIDGETPLAFYEGFMALGTQFHPESRYNEVSHYGDGKSNQRQTQLLNSFIELCKHHDAFIQSALAEEKTRAEGIAARDAFYQKILERLDECAALKGV